jgi:hypothetical protein
MSAAETLDLAVWREPMWIAGTLVVFNRWYTGGVVGTVAMTNVEQVRGAFGIAANYTPTLSRHCRQRILFGALETS